MPRPGDLLYIANRDWRSLADTPTYRLDNFVTISLPPGLEGFLSRSDPRICKRNRPCPPRNVQ